MAKIAILGMGAIGAVYGRRLFEQYGADFAVIAKEERQEKLQKFGFTLNGKTYYPRVINPEQSSEKVELLILCVKNYQLLEALADVRSLVDENTLILPLLNGITARDVIQETFPFLHVFYGLCVCIDAVKTGHNVTNQEEGIIRFGEKRNDPPSSTVKKVQNWLTDAQIKVEVPQDMKGKIWKKWMMNVGINQVTALTGATYGQAMITKEGRMILQKAMMEVLDLASASNIHLTMQDLQETMDLLETFSPQGKTSMLQDVENHRKTEVEAFSGRVIKLGSQLQIPTPINETIYCFIKAKEAQW